MHVPVSSTQHAMAQLVLERKAGETKTLPPPRFVCSILIKAVGEDIALPLLNTISALQTREGCSSAQPARQRWLAEC